MSSLLNQEVLVLARLTEVLRARWESTGKHLLIEAMVGPEDAAPHTVVFALSNEAVADLLHLLPQAVAGKDISESPMQ